jgi:hypothetical protein
MKRPHKRPLSTTVDAAEKHLREVAATMKLAFGQCHQRQSGRDGGERLGGWFAGRRLYIG